MLNSPANQTDPTGLWRRKVGNCYYVTVAYAVNGEFQGYDTEVLRCDETNSYLRMLQSYLANWHTSETGGGGGSVAPPASSGGHAAGVADPRSHCWRIGIGTYVSDLSPIPIPPPNDAPTAAITAISTASAGAYQVSENLARRSALATAVRRKQFLDPTLKTQLAEEAIRSSKWASVTKALGDLLAEATIIVSAGHALRVETEATEAGKCNPNVF